MLVRSLMSAAALLSLTAITSAGAAEKAERASIPFASSGGIDEWRPDGDNGLYLRARGGQWYQAKLLGPCLGLNFTETIGYVSEPDGSFDNTSSILVDGQRCALQTLEKSDKPPTRKEKEAQKVK